MAKGNAFLDTSIIISKEFGWHHIRKKIVNLIGDLDKHTTTFAVMEVNCSLLKDAIFLYSLLIEDMDLANAFQRLSHYPLTERGRKRRLEIFGKITDKLQLRVADAITRLESLITGLHHLLLKDIILLESKTNCPLAEAKIEKVNQVYKVSLSCRRKTAKCNLDHFLRENKDNIAKILGQKRLIQN